MSCEYTLCTVIGETDGVFVVHGGLFSNPDVLINDIETIKRMKYASVLSKRPPPGVQPNAKDIMIEEMLWSDPWRKKGTAPSDRGSGVMFGPDVVVNFLQKNGLKTLVRSHECMENGVERIPVSETMNMYTVFSASNYSGGDNYAAILIFTSLQHDPEIQQFRASQPPPKSKVPIIAKKFHICTFPGPIWHFLAHFWHFHILLYPTTHCTAISNQTLPIQCCQTTACTPTPMQLQQLGLS